MRRLIIIIGIFISLTLFYRSSVSALAPKSPLPSAVDYSFPYPGILPDHPLYFLKSLRDQILLFVTRNPLKKSNLFLLIADKKLMMGYVFFERGLPEPGAKITVEAEKELLTAGNVLSPLVKSGEFPPGFLDRMELASQKHKEVIDNFLSSPALSRDVQTRLKEAAEINGQASERIIYLNSTLRK
jgi:hypothetical protein